MFFMSTWWGDSKNMEEIEFSWWLFECRPRQGKNVLPDGLNWLYYFAGNSKSHCENSISFIFLESPHQVDMKNVVKSSKHFFGYFNTLETHSETVYEILLRIPFWNCWGKQGLALEIQEYGCRFLKDPQSLRFK